VTLRSALLVLVASSLAAVALSFGISSASQEPGEDGALGIEWDYRPESLPDLVAESAAVVMATVEQVRSGDPLVLAEAADGAPVETIPTELIDLRVTSEVEGTAPETITLYQLGAGDVHAVDDPKYVVGERYMLFVEPRLNDAGTTPHPDGTWMPVAPDGRLERLSSGVLDAQVAGPVAAELDGETVSEADAAIDATEEAAQ
jgi:hypothetical protein